MGDGARAGRLQVLGMLASALAGQAVAVAGLSREGVMLGMDEPIHGRLRSSVSKAFSQKSLARWQDGLAGRVANSLIDKFAANGKADGVDLAAELADEPRTRDCGLGRPARLLRADTRGAPGRAEGRSDQRPRCG